MKNHRIYLGILFAALFFLALGFLGKREIAKKETAQELALDITATEEFQAPIGYGHFDMDDGSDDDYDNREMVDGQFLVSYPPKVRSDREFEIKISLTTHASLLFIPNIRISALSFETSSGELKFANQNEEKTVLLKPLEAGIRYVTLETSYERISDNLVDDSRDLPGFVDLSTADPITERLEIEVTEKPNFLGLSNGILSFLQGIAALLGIPSLIQLIRSRKKSTS